MTQQFHFIQFTFKVFQIGGPAFLPRNEKEEF